MGRLTLSLRVARATARGIRPWETPGEIQGFGITTVPVVCGASRGTRCGLHPVFVVCVPCAIPWCDPWGVPRHRSMVELVCHGVCISHGCSRVGLKRACRAVLLYLTPTRRVKL